MTAVDASAPLGPQPLEHQADERGEQERGPPDGLRRLVGRTRRAQASGEQRQRRVVHAGQIDAAGGGGQLAQALVFEPGDARLGARRRELAGGRTAHRHRDALGRADADGVHHDAGLLRRGGGFGDAGAGVLAVAQEDQRAPGPSLAKGGDAPRDRRPEDRAARDRELRRAGFVERQAQRAEIRRQRTGEERLAGEQDQARRPGRGAIDEARQPGPRRGLPARRDVGGVHAARDVEGEENRLGRGGLRGVRAARAGEADDRRRRAARGDGEEQHPDGAAEPGAGHGDRGTVPRLASRDPAPLAPRRPARRPAAAAARPAARPTPSNATSATKICALTGSPSARAARWRARGGARSRPPRPARPPWAPSCGW